MKEHHIIFLDRNYLILRVVLLGLALTWVTASLSEVTLPTGNVTKVALWLFATIALSSWAAISFWMAISIILLWRRDIQFGRSADRNERAASKPTSTRIQLPPVESFEKSDLPIDLLRALMMEEKHNGR